MKTYIIKCQTILPTVEIKTFYFNRDERGMFLETYLRFTKEDTRYADVVAYGVDLDKLEVKILDVNQMLEDF